MTSTETVTDEHMAPPGLEGVVVADTAIGSVRGDEGFYHYRQYSAPELARDRTVEEVWHLLHHGRLPDAAELAEHTAATAAMRALPPSVAAALPSISAAAPEADLLAVVRTGVSLVAAHDDMRSWLDTDPATLQHQGRRLVATLPTLVAALWRIRNGETPVDPDPGLPLAADYLRMVHGVPATAEQVRAVERYLVLTVDHGFNASTFTTRTVASTGADIGAAVVAGIGALSGPLHGGAPSRALDMLREIGTADCAATWVDETLARGGRIMGFGHRVYRTEDPRSALLMETAQGFGGPLVDLAVEVEGTVLERLQQHRPGRELRTNVEYYAGVALHLAGLPQELFTPSFAISRSIGWTAHAIEQCDGNRIIRPRARYVGPPPT